VKPIVPLCLVSLAALSAPLPEVRAQAEKPVPAKERPLGKGIRCVTFSPDGTLLAATLGEPKERGRVVLWDVAKQKQLWSHLEDDGVPTAVFAPDGKTMAIGNYDKSAKLLETQTGRRLKVFEGHTNYVRAVAFSPDGKTLATGSWDGSVWLWDLATGEVQRTLDGPEFVYALHFSPKGRWLLAANGRARLWDPTTGKESSVFGKDRVVDGWAMFLDDDRFVAICRDGTVRVCNAASGEQRVLCKRYASRLAFSVKAKALALSTGHGTVELFDFPPRDPTAKEMERIGNLLTLLDDERYDVREAAGKELLNLGIVAEAELRRAAKESSSVEVRIRARRLHEAVMAKPRSTLTGHTGDVEGLAYSPDGQLLATGGRDGTVRLWNLKHLKDAARLTPEVP
jgi:WD40 repeat protein